MTDEEQINKIKKALALDGAWTWDDCMRFLNEGRWQIFYNVSGTWITELIHTPNKKWLNVVVVAGELPGCMDLQNEVEEFAKKHNCTEITAVARLGWRDVSKNWGWKTTSMVIKKELS